MSLSPARRSEGWLMPTALKMEAMVKGGGGGSSGVDLKRTLKSNPNTSGKRALERKKRTLKEAKDVSKNTVCCKLGILSLSSGTAGVFQFSEHKGSSMWELCLGARQDPQRRSIFTRNSAKREIDYLTNPANNSKVVHSVKASYKS
jgi:hypothetical protein